MSNAVRYRDRAKAQPYLKISSADRGKLVEITAQDNGLGIDEEFTDRLFSISQRFHPDVTTGSGLGLYIVKKHVDKLGGTTSYTRSADGSMFTLLLNRTLPA